MDHLTKKKDNSLSEIVYQSIYKQVLTGKLKPWDKVTEAKISEAMNISRAPVREALKRLVTDRLLVSIPRSGCYVADLSPKEIDEIFEIRKRLERMAMEYAFGNFDRTKIQELKDKFESCRELPTDEFVKKEISLDTKLHKMISEVSGCTNLQEMLDKLKARIEVFRIKEANYAERAYAALEEHLEILNAILADDKIKAIEALIVHVDHTKRNILLPPDKVTNINN